MMKYSTVTSSLSIIAYSQIKEKGVGGRGGGDGLKRTANMIRELTCKLFRENEFIHGQLSKDHGNKPIRFVEVSKNVREIGKMSVIGILALLK